jgi:hypothetical protein
MRLSVVLVALVCACGSGNDATPSCTLPDSFDGTAGYWTRHDTAATATAPARTCTRATLYAAPSCVEACGQQPHPGNQQLVLEMCCAPASPCADTMALRTNPNGPQVASALVFSYGATCSESTGQVSLSGTLTTQSTADGTVQGSYDVTVGTRRLTGTFRLPAQCSQPGCGT